MLYFIQSTFSADDYTALRTVTEFLGKLPMDVLGENHELTCHDVCRILAATGVKAHVVDGYFRPGFLHSWLVTPSGAIIDPYPPFIGSGPLLIQTRERPDALNPWFGMYQEADIEVPQVDRSLILEAAQGLLLHKM